MREYELFLDESGRFTEGMHDDARRFASQIAGVIAPAGKLTAATAEQALRLAFGEVGEPLPAHVHAHEWRKGSRFDALVLALTKAIARQPRWQPVRLENREGLGFGAVESTYTRMVAEICVRALEQLTRGHGGEARLKVIAARYMVDGASQLPREEYLARLQEHLAFAAVRRGLAAESARWRLIDLELASGRTRRELQICDLLSNASHSNYGKLGGAAREALERCFGSFDFRLTVRDLSRRVDEDMDEGSFGLALRALAEELVGGALSEEAKEDAEVRLATVLDVLADLPAPTRAPQLSVLTVWLEQLNEQRRDATLGLAAANWLMAHVEAPLRTRLGESAHTLDAFSLTLLRQKLTAANHRGALCDARDAAAALDALIPRLAGRWEHAPLIIESFVARSVHLTDVFEHDRAAREMRAVAEYYATLSSLMRDALDVFPAEVRSEQRGRALGTQMQAEMYAGLADPLRLEEARRLNDAAMKELAAPADIARQQQYRCQLETFAGDLRRAREWLAMSIGVDPTHERIAAHILELAPVPQGFALLHWLRLGAAILGASDAADREAFVAALDASKVHTLAWCTAADTEYPAHGVRRQLAIIAARRGRSDDAASVLGQLRRLRSDPSSRPVLAMLEAAAHLEVAGLLWPKDAKTAKRLLGTDDRDKPGARATVRALQARIADEFPALSRLLKSWDAAIGRALSGQLDGATARDELLAAARVVGY